MRHAEGAILGTPVRAENAALVDGDGPRVQQVGVLVDEDADSGLNFGHFGVVVEDRLVADDRGVFPDHVAGDLELGFFDVNETPEEVRAVVEGWQVVELELDSERHVVRDRHFRRLQRRTRVRRDAVVRTTNELVARSLPLRDA